MILQRDPSGHFLRHADGSFLCFNTGDEICCCGGGFTGFTTDFCFKYSGIQIPSGCRPDGFIWVRWGNPNGFQGRVNLIQRSGTVPTWASQQLGTTILNGSTQQSHNTVARTVIYRPVGSEPQQPNCQGSYIVHSGLRNAVLMRRMSFTATTDTFRFDVSLTPAVHDRLLFSGSAEFTVPRIGGIPQFPPTFLIPGTFDLNNPGQGGEVLLTCVPPCALTIDTSGCCEHFTIDVSAADASTPTIPQLNFNGTYTLNRNGPGSWLGTGPWGLESTMNVNQDYWFINIRNLSSGQVPLQWYSPRVAGQNCPPLGGAPWTTSRTPVKITPTTFNTPPYRDEHLPGRVVLKKAGTCQPPSDPKDPCDRCPPGCSTCCQTLNATIAGSDEPQLNDTFPAERQEDECRWEFDGSVKITIECRPEGWVVTADGHGRRIEWIRRTENDALSVCPPESDWEILNNDGTDSPTLVLACGDEEDFLP